MALYDFVPVEKAKEALALPSHYLVLDLENQQIECLHKQILTKNIQVTFCVYKCTIFLRKISFLEGGFWSNILLPLWELSEEEVIFRHTFKIKKFFFKKTSEVLRDSK